MITEGDVVLVWAAAAAYFFHAMLNETVGKKDFRDYYVSLFKTEFCTPELRRIVSVSSSETVTPYFSPTSM